MKKEIFKNIIIVLITLLIAFRSISFYSIVYKSSRMPELSSSTLNTILKLKQVYSQPQSTIRIMTYNLLSDETGFEGSPAYTRANGVCTLLNNLLPDVIGVQEMSRSWHYYLNKETQYSFVAPIKTALTNSMTAILYNHETLILKSCGEKALSHGVSLRLRKYLWATFETVKSKTTFTVVNTHFSLNKNASFTPLIQAMELIEFSKELTQNHPVFFIGDFNTTQTSDSDSGLVYNTLKTCFTDTKTMAATLSAGTEKNANAPFVDHIFLKGNAKILNYIILSNKEFSFFSDHYPILADVIINF